MRGTSQEGSPARAGSVLIVSGASAVRTAAKAALEAHGFRVAEAQDAASGLIAFDALRPALVLLDADSPESAELAVCRELRRLPGGRQTPVLVITTADDPTAGRRCWEAGASDFCCAPIDGDALAWRVRCLIRTAEGVARRPLAERSRGAGPQAPRLLDRARFCEILEETLADGVETGALLLLDLDRFKSINDSVGHAGGDRLLDEIADHLLGLVRSTDVVARPALGTTPTEVARMGGDEFVVLLPGLRRGADASRVAERMLEELARPIEIVGREIRASASIGIALWPRDANDAESLLRCADVALQEAKALGGSRCQPYSEELGARRHMHVELERELRFAAERDELRLLYQPVVDAHTRRTIGAEALLRWQHPGRGLLTPAVFLAVAEETGAIEPIGRWVLQRACGQHRAWREEGLEPGVLSVNVSGVQLSRPELVREVSEILEVAQMDARDLTLEITETALMRDAATSQTLLRRLREMHVRVALDDFGMGYSSLSQLKRLPIDFVKIDRTFLVNVPTDDDDTRIAHAILVLARGLRLSVVAEGVENERQLAFLQQSGCAHVQGYLFARPLLPEAFAERLRAERSQPSERRRSRAKRRVA